MEDAEIGPFPVVRTDTELVKARSPRWLIVKRIGRDADAPPDLTAYSAAYVDGFWPRADLPWVDPRLHGDVAIDRR